MFLIRTTNPTLCTTGSFARVWNHMWNGWELNPEPIDCKLDALPLCHCDMSYTCV